MSRNATAAVQPLNPMDEGDDHFIGWNMKLDRGQLKPGYYALANNKRVNRGVAETRPGTLTPVWANVVAFGSILGSGNYSNPSGLAMMLIATPTQVLMVRSGAYPTTVSMPSGVTLSGTIEFSQQFDKVLLHRGQSSEVSGQTLVWDGVSPAGFVPVTKSDPLNTVTSVIPNVPWSINLGNRSIIPLKPDTLAFSDLLDYTTFDLTLTGPKFRTNSGTADPIVGAFPYAQRSLIIGKRNSFDLLTDVLGDLSTTTMEVLSSTVGIWARKSWAMAGGDGLFLSNPGGVFRISQVIQDRLQTDPVPVSDSIAPMIARINWAYADKAVAAVLGPYYFLAVPLDGSITNNAVLVYNTVTSEWEGYDTWDAAGPLMQIDNLLVADYYGGRRLYAINHGSAAIHLLYEGRLDELAYDRVTGQHAVYEIADLLETRGYSRIANLGYLFDYRGAAELGAGEKTPSQKDFQRAEVNISTWRPSIMVTELTEKAGDERALTATPVTKSNTKYDIAFKPDYDVTNVNGDFGAPGRQDYSVDPASGFYPAGDGDKKQASTLRFSTKVRGRYVSLRIANSQGVCDVAGVLLESTGAPVQMRRAA